MSDREEPLKSHWNGVECEFPWETARTMRMTDCISCGVRVPEEIASEGDVLNLCLSCFVEECRSMFQVVAEVYKGAAKVLARSFENTELAGQTDNSSTD